MGGGGGFPLKERLQKMLDIGGSHDKEVKESITGMSENLDTLQT